ncbi:MAG: metallophosphoesterase family protein [Polyangiales bacterium]
MADLERILVVGDVHGCADELDDLLRVAGFRAGDRLVFVGDLIAKGPDSAGVVARARAASALAVKGNHEARVLLHAEALRDGREPPKIGKAHRAAAESLSEADWDYLFALPYLVELPEHGVLVVHAALDPRRPLDAQDPDVMMNGRSIRPDGEPSARIEDGVPWGSRWPGPMRVIFGHDAVRKLQVHPFALGIDTGCVYGGDLTAVELPSFRRYSVPARQVWCPP